MLASRRLTGSRKDLQRLEDGEGGMFLAFPPAHLAPGSLHRPQAWSYALQGLLCHVGTGGVRGSGKEKDANQTGEPSGVRSACCSLAH